MANLGSSTDIPAYIGIWTNWSQGRITGTTLTVTHRDGTLLTAFLAMFVTFVGTSFWRIASFSLHQFLSSSASEDGLYHQTQAILRNSSNGTTGLIRLIYLLSAWRLKATRPLRRIIPLISTITIITAAFAVASLFSAKISSGTGNEILISSNRCGSQFLGDLNIVDDTMVETILLPDRAKKEESYANYVKTCYTNVSNARGCDSFIERQLISTIDSNASCPFEGALCRHPHQNLKLDTGPMSLTSELALAVSGYKQTFNYSSDISYARLFYGRKSASGEPANIELPEFSYETQIPSLSQILSEDNQGAIPDYQIGVSQAYTFNASLDSSSSSFMPIKEFLPALENNDVFLIFLSANKILFASEVNDDWYAAHQFLHTSSINSENVSGYTNTYLSDEPASPLGCKAHYEVCSPNSNSGQICPASGGIFDFPPPNLQKNTQEYSIIQWVSGGFADIGALISSLGSASLTSRSSLNNGVQGALPDNQWQSDVEYWFNLSLVSLQSSVVDMAIGPDDPGIEKYFWAKPDDFQRRHLCTNQKIRSSAYTNFSVLGLAITLIIGGIIIVLGYTLESIVAFIERHRGKIKYSRLEWSAHDILQTQRMAHEELGFGIWTDCAGIRAVPVTTKAQMLASLDTEDPDHPRLKTPSIAAGDEHGGKTSSSPSQIESNEESGVDTRVRTDGEQSTMGDEAQVNPISGEDEEHGELSAHEISTDDVEPPTQSRVDSHNGQLCPSNPGKVVVAVMPADISPSEEGARHDPDHTPEN